ncbi:E3 ubiquitin-protein ligase rnf168-like isoform X2 [Takifugu rubripes]|uniref:E3 ubiquitin-protein ligase rnf168-like isoform X2 n=1 Tax=Takifugu rubripes TaxID=31033 RepID=UPI00114577CC|nr:E3 ubiquitin-protein ligase rnf168-like isoform X2 [Takifugu rubripes]
MSGRGGRRESTLTLQDCRCPVCLEILCEPVTLPCTHTFCKGCFLESVDKATLCCPLCRKRVSTWARQNSRNNTLVNQQLWNQIQDQFPLHCQRRLSGQDGGMEDNLGVAVCVPRVSEPGELRQEYEDQVSRLTEEKRVFEEEERRASEEYIQRLLAEEEQLQEEQRRRHQDDERLARLISSQLNPADATPAKREVTTPAKREVTTPAKREVTTPAKREVTTGQMDKFLSPRPSQCSPADSKLTANKESMVSLSSLHQLELHGLGSESPDLLPTFLTSATMDQFHVSTDGETSSKRSHSDDRRTPPKRVCLQPCSTSRPDMPAVEQLSRQQQEEEDHRLALLLQKELDQEERDVNRRKGSSDAYSLRLSSQAKVASSSSTPRKTSSTPKTSVPKTSSAPRASSTTTSSPSVCRGRKQATLTEMFSSFSR